MKYLILFIFLLPITSEAGIKMRAREHFDIHNIDRDGVKETYTGLSNTINVWYEKPFDIAYGFSFNPLIGSARKDQSMLPELGGRVRFINIGAELKYFLVKGLFTRFGAGWSQLRSDGVLEISNGYNGYGGLGYEFLINDIGLALEAAYRHSTLQNDIVVGTFTPSLGVHFYNFF